MAWETAGPLFTIISPNEGSTQTSGQRVLITGRTSNATSASPVVSVTVNGIQVNAIDALGNFFAQVGIQPGENFYEVIGRDSQGRTTTATLKLLGNDRQDAAIDFDLLSDVTGSLVGVYGKTSFNESSESLFADLAIQNVGQFDADTPLIVGITNISNPSVRVPNADGRTLNGTPYFDYSELVNGATLGPGGSTGIRSIEFANPDRAQFTYDLVFLGELNEAPAITSVPLIEAIAEQPYNYDVQAIDPDSDSLSYRILSGPTTLQIDSESGQINWSPTVTDIGSYPMIGSGRRQSWRIRRAAIYTPGDAPARESAATFCKSTDNGSILR